MERVWRELKELGFAEFSRPDGEGIPELPEDITSLDDTGLMSLYSQFLAWEEFTAVQKVQAGVTSEEAETRLAQAKAMVTRIPEGAKSRDPVGTLMKAEILKDPEVMKATEDLRVAKYRYELLGTILNSLERRTAFASRELTRRTEAEPRQRRGARWQ